MASRTYTSLHYHPGDTVRTVLDSLTTKSGETLQVFGLEDVRIFLSLDQLATIARELSAFVDQQTTRHYVDLLKEVRANDSAIAHAAAKYAEAATTGEAGEAAHAISTSYDRLPA